MGFIYKKMNTFAFTRPGLWTFIATVGLGVLVSPGTSHAQKPWSSLEGWLNSAPDTTSDHFDGLDDRSIPSGAQYCWVAEISGNWIGVAYQSNGSYFGIIYSTYLGYNVRTSPNHTIQKSSSSNKTDVSIQLWNENRSGLIRFHRLSTGSIKEIPFNYGPCPDSRIPL